MADEKLTKVSLIVVREYECGCKRTETAVLPPGDKCAHLFDPCHKHVALDPPPVVRTGQGDYTREWPAPMNDEQRSEQA